MGPTWSGFVGRLESLSRYEIVRAIFWIAGTSNVMLLSFCEYLRSRAPLSDEACEISDSIASAEHVSDSSNATNSRSTPSVSYSNAAAAAHSKISGRATAHSPPSDVLDFNSSAGVASRAINDLHPNQ